MYTIIAETKTVTIAHGLWIDEKQAEYKAERIEYELNKESEYDGCSLYVCQFSFEGKMDTKAKFTTFVDGKCRGLFQTIEKAKETSPDVILFYF